MCFTPAISLLIALFEWSVAGFLLFSKRKTQFPLTIPMFMIFLGLYQFTEFMLCITGSVHIWGRLGFIAYTYLPALGMCSAWDYCNVKYNKALVVLTPTIFALFAIFKSDFILSATCTKYFVIIKNSFYGGSSLVYLIYVLYYFGTIVYIVRFLFQKYRAEKEKMQKRVYCCFLFGIVGSLLPALVLFIIFPGLGVIFPSLYCEFAVLFTITMLLAYHFDTKAGTKKKSVPKYFFT